MAQPLVLPWTFRQPMTILEEDIELTPSHSGLNRCECFFLLALAVGHFALSWAFAFIIFPLAEI